MFGTVYDQLCQNLCEELYPDFLKQCQVLLPDFVHNHATVKVLYVYFYTLFWLDFICSYSLLACVCPFNLMYTCTFHSTCLSLYVHVCKNCRCINFVTVYNHVYIKRMGAINLYI